MTMRMGVDTAIRADLESVRAKLEGANGGLTERLALAEVYFRLAVLPDTELEAAIDGMRQATACDPYHPKLFYHLGRLLHKNGNPVGAIFEYRRALRLAPRSHRTYVHLALALSEAGSEEQKLGLNMLEALHSADDARLAEITAKLDDLLSARLGTKFKPKKEPEPKPAAAPGDAPGKRGETRWKGLWKLFLLNELARPKPKVKLAAQQMEAGKQLIEGNQGVSEYVIASLFFVLEGPKTCRQLDGWLREPALLAHHDRPAVRLVKEVCELGDSGGAEQFIERASGKLASSELPPELVCCLHYAWYGTAANLDAVAAVALLDRYPDSFRWLPCFRELRLAILDYHARLAWTAERLEHAEILWRATIPIDPFRISVAHNLALAATRTKSLEKYQPAWERAIELRYLLAASAADVQVELEDRCRLHRSFFQQSILRYVAESPARHSADPTDDELRSWMKDRDAIEVWLRDGTLLYLNNRLRFRSPLHLLGLPLDCSDEDADSAGDNLVSQFALCFRGRRWAGAQVFLHTVEQMARLACEQVKDPVARRRDPYFETEAPEASVLADEVTTRGLLMFRMVKLASAATDKNLKRSALDVARFLLSMPWKALEPRWKKKGNLSLDTDLIPVFVSYVAGLVLDTEGGDVPDKEAKLKLEAVDDLVRAVPESLDLRLVQCRLLQEAGENLEAYQGAVEALSLAAKLTDRAEAAKLERQFAIVADNAALSQIPKDLLSPTRDKVPAMVAAGKRVLVDFPKAGGLRLLMAKFLIQTVDDDRKRLDQATELLEQGLDLFLTDQQLNEARQLMDKAGAQSRSFEEIRQVRKLLESASTRARHATAALREERTPARVRQAREEFDLALHEAEQAEEVANGAGLQAAAGQAHELAEGLRKMIEDIEKG